MGLPAVLDKTKLQTSIYFAKPTFSNLIRLGKFQLGHLFLKITDLDNDLFQTVLGFKGWFHETTGDSLGLSMVGWPKLWLDFQGRKQGGLTEAQTI